ncbi:hypothetical protein FA95DRAFT_1094653 [Auriscalpium vulgare]|uniref:Uncharacterized protein n=1 Tax=Auriscalpium vulgare TaxID=40419 RepID=A0ACB8R5D1_9AGAM|nr:hypothetical protein FA95DRAFT_1094653 [Auriscalpium vulgare]
MWRIVCSDGLVKARPANRWRREDFVMMGRGKLLYAPDIVPLAGMAAIGGHCVRHRHRGAIQGSWRPWFRGWAPRHQSGWTASPYAVHPPAEQARRNNGRRTFPAISNRLRGPRSCTSGRGERERAVAAPTPSRPALGPHAPTTDKSVKLNHISEGKDSACVSIRINRIN